MKNLYAAIIFVLAGCLGTSVLAQNVDFTKKNFPTQKKELKKALKEIKKGDENYLMGQKPTYLTALEHYIKANEFNPKNAKLNYKIGKCYLHTIQKTKSIDYFEKAIKLGVQKNDVYFFLGQAYQLNYEFEKAIKSYEDYRKKLSPAELEEKDILIKKKINECKTAKKLMEEPARVFIDNIGTIINSSFYEYSPIINADETQMIFTSRRSDSYGGHKDPVDLNYFEDIYMSERSNDKWGSPVNMGKPMNSEKHDATVGFAPDGQKLFVYKGSNGGDIYECKLKGDKWSKPKKLSKRINTGYHETSASFSFDGRTIYFVSDRPGGVGGQDIYMSTLDEKGKWGKAVNLGSVVNTAYDEEGVFMLPDGKTLYFSSKGHNNMGGYDVFRTVFEEGKWSTPVNIGYPINTPDDDVFFSVSASGQHGYFSSEREGGLGGQDIYMATFLGDEKPMFLNTEDNLLASITEPVKEAVIESAVEIATTQLTLLKGLVLDETTKNPIGATIELLDNEAGTVLATFASNSSTGKYLVSLPAGKNYGIRVEAENYLFHSENFIVPESSEYKVITKDIFLKKIEVGKKIVLKNIFFDFAKADLRSESTLELDRLTELMVEMPGLKIEISGHTDNKGSEQYNQGLSERRAKAVVDYLISKGIDANRLQYKGYGESQPIATNDTEEGRQLNRRTEFQILEK